MAIAGTVDACVFDAYGTLFDFNAAVAARRDQIGEKADQLSDVWRQKQVQYTWLRSLMQRHADFWQVTGEALDFALAAVGIDNPALRAELMELYRRLDTYPEVPDMLRRLKHAGIRTAILSNGAPTMLQDAVDNVGLGELLDHVLSVEDIGVFKPDPRVYQLAVDRLGVPASAICFQSANGWDASGAAAFGFQVVWVNRSGQPPEHLPGTPAATLTSLDTLAALVGA